MKKIIKALMLLLCFLPICGCAVIDSGELAQDPEKLYTGADVTVISADRNSLTVKIVNNSESVWQSGNMRDYELQMLHNGEWYKVKQIGEFANTMELMVLVPGEDLEHTFEFTQRYGILSNGSYRVVKSYWANSTETEDGRSFDLVINFKV